MAAAAALAEQESPGLEVEQQLVVGYPIDVLGAESGRAQLVVIGDRGLGGLTGLLVGSVAPTKLQPTRGAPLVAVHILWDLRFVPRMVRLTEGDMAACSGASVSSRSPYSAARTRSTSTAASLPRSSTSPSALLGGFNASHLSSAPPSMCRQAEVREASPVLAEAVCKTEKALHRGLRELPAPASGS